MDFYRHIGDNLGGIYQFRFTWIENIQEIPEVLSGRINHAVELVAGTKWYEGYCTKDTMFYKEGQEDGDQGAAYNKEFSGFVPKDREDLVDLFDQMKNRRCILDIVDNNGNRRLVGNTNEPMYFSSAFDSKNEPSGRAGFNISFKGSGKKNSPHYYI